MVFSIRTTAALPLLVLLAAAAAPAADPDLETVRLGERSLLVRAGGNNVVALAGKRGLVVIDTGASPELGLRIRRTVESAFGRGDFLFVVNTHAHWDHTWGNQAFKDATIVGHANGPAHMRRTFEEQQALLEAPPVRDPSSIPPPPPRSRVLNAEPGVEPQVVEGDGGEMAHMTDELRERLAGLALTPPTVTFEQRHQLDLGDLTVDLLYYGEGHTDSDILVLVREESLLATGDLFWKDQLPPLAGAGRLDVPRWLGALDRALESGSIDHVVPGHGKLMTRADLVADRDYIAAVWQAVRAARGDGESLEIVQKRLALKTRFPDLVGLEVTDDRGGSLHRSNVEALWRAAAEVADSPSRGSGMSVSGGVYPRWDGAPSPPRTGTVTAAGVELYYETSGQGETLLLLHGGGLDGRMWEPQTDTLGQHYHMVRVDLPGHGKSPVPPNPFCHGEVLRDLLLHLGIDSAHVIGLSGGAIAGMHLAVEHPEMVRTLVLVAPGLGGWEWSRETRERLTTIITAAHEQGPEVAAELWFEDPYMVPAMEHPELVDRLRQWHLENAHTWVATIKALPLHPAAIDRLADVAIPALILVGDRDDGEIQAIARRLDADLPDSRKIVLSGVGHMVNLEAPEAFDEAVLGFVGGPRAD